MDNPALAPVTFSNAEDKAIWERDSETMKFLHIMENGQGRILSKEYIEYVRSTTEDLTSEQRSRLAVRMGHMEVQVRTYSLNLQEAAFDALLRNAKRDCFAEKKRQDTGPPILRAK